MANYFLRTKKTSGKASLHTNLRSADYDLKINVGIRVNIEEWNNSRKSARAQRNYYSTEEGKKVQQHLDKVEAIIHDLTISGELKKPNRKEILEKAISAISDVEAYKIQKEVEAIKKEQESKDKKSILNYLDLFIQGATNKEVFQKTGAKQYTEATIKQYRNLANTLKGYINEKVTFDDIGKPFADGFRTYLEGKCELLPTTANKYFLCMRRLCNKAITEGITENIRCTMVWYEKAVSEGEKAKEIALTQDEVAAIWNLKLDGIREQVRDIFILGLSIGQRVSDYTTLSRENFVTLSDGTRAVHLRQKKTNNEVVVPIIDEEVVNTICSKYDYDFPKLNQADINRYIKEVAYMAASEAPSLNTLYPTILTSRERERETIYQHRLESIKKGQKLNRDEIKSQKRDEKYRDIHNSADKELYARDASGKVLKFKWELCSTHTARRTCITILNNSGLLRADQIMKISGHRTIKTYEKYIKNELPQSAMSIASELAGFKFIKASTSTLKVAK